MVKLKIALKNQAGKSGSLKAIPRILILCFGLGVNKLLSSL